jgi:phosphotransferase system enzyme I (PtsP)
MLVAGRFDPLSRPFLRALRDLARAADAADVPISLCGEMAGNPLAAMTHIGLGYRSLSMSADAIGPVKAMTHAINTVTVGTALHSLLDHGGSESVRPALTALAEAQGVPL